MGKELVLYSKEAFWRHYYERLGGIIDICSRRREIDKKANEICKPYGLTARMLYIPTIGIKGDDSVYELTMEVTSSGNPDYEILKRISNRITNEINGITRVVYSI
jgi:GMP synthase PP-ATPase subunit